ncbi:malectin domain-containing carbohydrate-binding protein [Anditalea andensis]|uniref:Glycoside hydrolase n=1 Tax=Anditalea andensis TaxID=1048983 RepID=A0A074L349_9BACT|nr:malectin domain-containing carbohydrate-binding protein [Anditalea andensis]KEO74303.1 glycoside hydrolase [Anditalea andensis]
MLKRTVTSTFFLLILCLGLVSAQQTRKQISLNSDWKTIASGVAPLEEKGIEAKNYNAQNWISVDVPHNWDQYEGYRRMKHGNKHGAAWYRKNLTLDNADKGKQHFLFFEGVGSYATVWINGKKVGGHAGGRTTFTLDITEHLDFNGENTIAVKADHPSMIADLPWVCGGCSGEWGFSEGSQPMGIFRPVSLLITDQVKIEPFGIHIWNDDEISKEKAKLQMNTTIKNYGDKSREITIVNRLIDKDGKEVERQESPLVLEPKATKETKQETAFISQPKLWSPKDPYLYKMITEIHEDGKVIDELVTPYGIRWVSWPIGRDDGDHRFFINGEPLYINGICEYEHMMGQSHAFTDEQVLSRVNQMVGAGFNAFRDAHQPHHFKYHEEWDKQGVLLWTQFSAHIWYDTPEFKENFKELLKEWVIERRNSPSVVMWGLQNESTIPKEFAQECTELIRELDPNSYNQKLVTTCNGGEGTDWNVVQNWSGTYGGDPEKYGEELSRQLLNGEYGAWRTLDLHTEGPFVQKGDYSEDRFYQLMQKKVELAEAYKDSLSGQFHWLYNSHENPGRIQNGEGFRDIDRVGPINYKGLVTPWEEPLDAYFMYRSEYSDKVKEPMVYIVSHTWPDRWIETGIKDSLVVFSNCDEVELFNDTDGKSLGRKKNPGMGKNFQWDQVDIQYNVLKAIGYVDGKEMAEDIIVLHHLPESPNFQQLYSDDENLLQGDPDFHYIYRVNAGGPDYIDQNGHLWMSDVQKTTDNSWGSKSWTDEFADMPAFYASQRRTHDPISGSKDWDLFQTFRFGMTKLKYEFPLPDGEYLMDLFFIEPWYGTGAGLNSTGWRTFDVAINDETVIQNLDIWKEAGHDKALKKTVKGQAKDGKLILSFPKITSGQAIISGIGIASMDKSVQPADPSPKNILDLNSNLKGGAKIEVQSWLDTGHPQFSDSDTKFSKLPYLLFGADYIRLPFTLPRKGFSGNFIANKNSIVYVLINDRIKSLPRWMEGFLPIEEDAENNQGENFSVYTKEVSHGEKIQFGSVDKLAKSTSGGMYSIVVVPQYEMGDGEDERPGIHQEAETALFKGDGIETGNFKESKYIEFTEVGEAGIAWEVNPGLAGTYLIRFRYMNVSDEPINVRLQIEASNGVMMRDDEISFPVADEKWRILNTTTGTSINAGKYIIRIHSEDLKGLRLDRMEFQ